MKRQNYQLIADRVASHIQSGKLKPGQRLPPQRDFADQYNIAASTASRVYAELTRRGLVTGEIGRGTFVRAVHSQSTVPLAHANPPLINLELNFPILPHQETLLAHTLPRLLRPEVLAEAMQPVLASSSVEARLVAARFLARDTWRPDPANILFTGNGRQAIAAAFSALALPGERIGVEAITYPVAKSIASRLGIHLIPLAMDEGGVKPEAIIDASRNGALRGLYLQPTIHNPLGVTMSIARRKAVADALRSTGLVAIEDLIYGFLADIEPLAAFAPENVILIDSLSKRIAPGLTVGMMVSPSAMLNRLTTSLRTGAWGATGFPLAIALQWMADGTATKLSTAKRVDAFERNALACKVLSGFNTYGDARGYHVWLELPESWRAEIFCAATMRNGIALAPSSAFTVAAGYAPNAVRIALASPEIADLERALKTLRKLLVDGPDPLVE